MRTIKARALNDNHTGALVSCDAHPEPARLHGCTTGITFAALFWAPPAAQTDVELGDEITIHDEEGT
ncbi:MAG: hypothetical protein ACRDTJ_15775 [Pseudonocardiaceae bacterium]